MNENYLNYSILLNLKSLLTLPPNITYNLKPPYFINELPFQITPKSGVYANFPLQFLLSFPDDFPLKPPTILALKDIFHPNVLYSQKVCLNVLKNGWRAETTISSVFLQLLCLLEEPNFDDYANQEAKECFDRGFWEVEVLKRIQL